MTSRKVLIIVGWLATILTIISWVAFETINVLEGKGAEQYTSYFGLRGMPIGIVLTAIAAIAVLLIGAYFKLREYFEEKSLLHKYGNPKHNNENQPN